MRVEFKFPLRIHMEVFVIEGVVQSLLDWQLFLGAESSPIILVHREFFLLTNLTQVIFGEIVKLFEFLGPVALSSIVFDSHDKPKQLLLRFVANRVVRSSNLGLVVGRHKSLKPGGLVESIEGLFLVE